MNSDERERLEQAPDRLWVELRTQHAFTAEPEPYVETVAYMPVDLFNAQYEGLMRAALLREQTVATRMRDLCVAQADAAEADAAERLGLVPGNTAFENGRLKAAHEIREAIESLTLDQVEEKQ